MIKDDTWLHQRLDEMKAWLDERGLPLPPFDPEEASDPALFAQLVAELFPDEDGIRTIRGHVVSGRFVVDHAPPPLRAEGNEIALPDGQRLRIELVPASAGTF
jgi:hypothetical protein